VTLLRRWTRGCRPLPVSALGISAALAGTLAVAGCTSTPASSAASAQHPAAPAITGAQAREVFDRDAASGRYSYGSPAFYLPEAAGYPHFFVASVTRTLRSSIVPADASTQVGDATVPVDGPTLMLFEQASKGAQWRLASTAQLPAGTAVPPLARDGSGYIPIVTPTAGALLVQPDYVGALQAAVVDDGQQSAAAKAVAAGPLTTGIYEGAVNHASGLTAPHGDVYQWELAGVNNPEFALRTADGGALVFYTMTLNTTVAVPGYINKANPVRSGPPIPVPASLKQLLPTGQSAPTVQLSSVQTLSFAAVDPAPGGAKIQVIAIGGGLTSASAS
jgi:hypothetical protein